MNIKDNIIEKLKYLESELKRRPVKKDSSSLYALSRKHFGTWNKMLKVAGYKTKDFQKPTIPKEITNELSYFLGLVSTDGHLQIINTKGHYKLMIYTSEKEEVDLIVKLVQELFNYKASIRSRKTGFKNSRPNYEVYISSKSIVNFVNSLGIPIGAKSSNIDFPKIFFKEDKYLWHYIRGVFDGDGSIIFSGKNHIFKVTSGSIKFIKRLNKILKVKGFEKFKICKDNRGNTWDLRNNTKVEINKLYNLIYKDSSFFYPRKKLKWESQHI